MIQLLLLLVNKTDNLNSNLIPKYLIDFHYFDGSSTKED